GVWDNLSQTGRTVTTTGSVVWQSVAGDPLESGLVSGGTAQMLALAGSQVTAALSRVSVRLKLLPAWSGWARMLSISDSLGNTLVQLERSGDSLQVRTTGTGATSMVRQDTLWHTYTWERTGSGWRILFDAQHLLSVGDPTIRPGQLLFAEGGGILLSELMLWSDTTVHETIPVGGWPKVRVVAPLE
ncbi:MAG TPA: hypothetical protein PKW90_28745, partial [Myxococcota bacterium]|nr:hypothetical protein [Myxococcota bacterium]